MNYQEWLSFAVAVSDLRPFCSILEGYELQDRKEKVPGVLFMKRGGADYYQVGVIEQHSNGQWDVIIGDSENTFVSFDQAAKWLWDNHWKRELQGPSYVLYQFTLQSIPIDDVNLARRWLCENEAHMIDIMRNHLPEDDYFEQCYNNLLTYNYATYPGGWFVSFLCP
jgi:hypothetical protein